MTRRLGVHGRAKRYVSAKRRLRAGMNLNPEEDYNTLHLHEAFVAGFRSSERAMRESDPVGEAYMRGYNDGVRDGSLKNPTVPEGAYMQGVEDGRKLERDIGEATVLRTQLEALRAKMK